MGLFRKRKPDLGELQSLAAAAFAASAKAAAEPAKSALRRLPLRWRATIYMASAAATVSAAGLGALLLYFTLTIPDPLAYRRQETQPVVKILARDGSVLAERGSVSAYVPLELVPRQVTAAVLATEDRRFWDHWGLDPIGLLRAFLANLRAGRFAQGGSTLTQQLAKNMFLAPDRTLSRKAEELALAIWLELRLTKSEILELYLNRVYFGGGAYGIEAAAQRFFEKSASELSLAEAAVIAGLLKAPSRYAPSANPEQALARGRVVLESMRDAGAISAQDHAAARLESVRFSDGRRASDRSGLGYAADAVMEQLPRTANASGGEIMVETTIDAELQRRASSILSRELKQQGEALAVSQGAAIVLDLDGGIRAVVGGRAYLESQFNRAMKARRQPGSAFKPFVYLAALEKGYTPSSLVYDLPLDVNGWAPRNDNGKYQGAIPLGRALAQSVNTVAVHLLLDASAREVAAVAARLGIRSPLRVDPSLALGTSEVSIEEMAGAYAPFANGGFGVEPYLIRRVRSASGRVLYARERPPRRQLVAPAHVAAMNEMLHAVMTVGTGRKARFESRPAGGKTGTSQEFRDAWFVGYTADLVAAVWTGNDDGRPTNRVVGGGLPALIWRDIMAAAHEGRAVAQLPGFDETQPRPAALALARQTSVRAAPPAERLPWLPMSVAQGLKAAPPRRAPSFPKENISSDFLARALEGGTLRPEDRAVTGAAMPAGGRIIVRPAGQGLMSLGGPVDNVR